MIKRPVNHYDRYHAHVYFDKKSMEQAVAMGEKAGALFEIEVGRVHCRLIGPHPCWSYQLSFNSDQFEQVVPWLETQRGNLSILSHALTGHDLADHTTHAY